MAVFAESFIDSFEEFLTPKDFKHLWDEKLIEFKPAQFLRGRSLKDSYILIDEFQNFDIKALKSIVTRLGRNSKIVFMGDTRQNDINKKYVAVDAFNEIIKPIKGCSIFAFEPHPTTFKKLRSNVASDNFKAFNLGVTTPSGKYYVAQYTDNWYHNVFGGKNDIIDFLINILYSLG